jgi:hypothetical protein
VEFSCHAGVIGGAMTNQLLECSFLIPVRRDLDVSDGRQHEDESWQWLQSSLLLRFEGVTPDRGTLDGFYKDPDTGKIVTDRSYRYTVAVEHERINELRELLAKACHIFQQKSIYLSIAGRVEFVESPGH